MRREPPPPVIDSARVLSYAFVDDITYHRYGSLYVDGVLLEQVPRLAICLNLGQDMGPLLYHCDQDWNVLGASGADTVEEVKQRAEKNYPGVATKWIDVNVSVEDALKYYDSDTGGLKCSFCGKRPFEVKGMVEGNGAIICTNCVEDYYHEFQSDDTDDSKSK